MHQRVRAGKKDVTMWIAITRQSEDGGGGVEWSGAGGRAMLSRNNDESDCATSRRPVGTRQSSDRRLADSTPPSRTEEDNARGADFRLSLIAQTPGRVKVGVHTGLGASDGVHDRDRPMRERPLLV